MALAIDLLDRGQGHGVPPPVPGAATAPRDLPCPRPHMPPPTSAPGEPRGDARGGVGVVEHSREDGPWGTGAPGGGVGRAGPAGFNHNGSTFVWPFESHFRHWWHYKKTSPRNTRLRGGGIMPSAEIEKYAKLCGNLRSNAEIMRLFQGGKNQQKPPLFCIQIFIRFRK